MVESQGLLEASRPLAAILERHYRKALSRLQWRFDNCGSQAFLNFLQVL
jgi:hypothetical protein